MRRKDREITNPEQILAIVEKAKVLHLGLSDADCPYVVPLHYGYEYTDGNLVFYMHCAKEGHKLDLIAKNPNVCVELECNVNLVAGGDVPCRYGSTFASVIGRGKAALVSDEQEKQKALFLLMNNQTGRDFAITPQMTARIAVLKVVVPDFTAKAGNG